MGPGEQWGGLQAPVAILEICGDVVDTVCLTWGSCFKHYFCFLGQSQAWMPNP